MQQGHAVQHSRGECMTASADGALERRSEADAVSGIIVPSPKWYEGEKEHSWL